MLGNFVDYDVLRTLQEIGGDDPLFLSSILDIFLKEAPRELAKMQSALDQRDAVAVGLIAHRLRSGAQNVGANRMVQLCLELDERGRAGQSIGLVELMNDLIREFKVVETYLRKILETGQIPQD
ncbi:hypothetical protein BH10BDE1_BH10BDE1_04410 [soil metagenome]